MWLLILSPKLLQADAHTAKQMLCGQILLATAFEQAIALGVLLIELLVVILCRPKGASGLDCCHNGLAIQAGSVQLLLGRCGNGTLFVITNKITGRY